MKYDRKKDMTKKAWKELQASRRVRADFNTGTRTMKTEKLPTRVMRKADFQKRVREEM